MRSKHLFLEQKMRDGLLDRDGSFPSDLKRLRTQQGMSESELAERIGRTHQCIRAYEAGEVRPQDWTVQALNNVLIGRNAWGVTVTG
jgi:ribosome-binding protein aMBF1 (putative translation factor)